MQLVSFGFPLSGAAAAERGHDRGLVKRTCPILEKVFSEFRFSARGRVGRTVSAGRCWRLEMGKLDDIFAVSACGS